MYIYTNVQTMKNGFQTMMLVYYHPVSKLKRFQQKDRTRKVFPKVKMMVKWLY